MSSQLNLWAGKFGVDYTQRNMVNLFVDDYATKYHGVSRTDMNKEFIEDVIPYEAKFLEVGCNAGQQFNRLLEIGYEERRMYGIDPNLDALEILRKDSKMNVIEGEAKNIPFKDNFFDVVFTSGVLIHIPEKDGELKRAMQEIIRCTKKWIWLFEYYSKERQEIDRYQGWKNMLWTDDYLQKYLNMIEPCLIQETHSKLYPFKNEKGKFTQMALITLK